MAEPLNWRNRIPFQDWMDPASKELFSSYAKDAELHRISEKRIEKYRADLKIIYSMSRMKPSETVKDLAGLEKCVRAINKSSQYKFATKKDCKELLASLFNFRHHSERSVKYAPMEVKKLCEHRRKPSEVELPKDVLMREEIRELLQFANTEDRAILFVLFESGARIAEFTGLHKSEVRITKEGAELRLKGKTGERLVDIVEASTYLTSWLEVHPRKGKDEAVWVNEENGKPISCAAIAKRIRTVVEKMNAERKKKGLSAFSKSVNPHNFRHSRATELGGIGTMNEGLLCRFFGWQLGSKMPSVYMHLRHDQVKNALLASYGKAKVESTQIISAKKCPRCKTDNSLAAKYCQTCGNDFELNKMPSTVEELREQVDKMQKQIDKLTPAAIYGTVAKAKRKYEEETSRRKPGRPV